MRRTEQEFRAEVIRRSEAFKLRRKKKLKNLLVSFSCLALLISVQQVLSSGFGGSSAECADEAVDYFAQNQAPAAMEEAESLQEEPMENIQDSSTDAQTTGSGNSDPFMTEIILQPEDYEILDAIDNNAYWTEYGHDCIMDVTIIRGEHPYRFSTECGTLYNVKLGMTAELSEEACEQLTELIQKYQ